MVTVRLAYVGGIFSPGTREYLVAYISYYRQSDATGASNNS